MKEKVYTKGHVRVQIIDQNGNVKSDKTFSNIVTTVGKAHIADQLAGVSAQNKMSHYAIGTGTNNPAIGDTALQTEIARVALSSAIATSNEIIYTAIFPAGVGTGTITEYGIFNALSGGTLLARAEQPAEVKGGSDAMIVEHTIEIN
jgi:hypothetical protein